MTQYYDKTTLQMYLNNISNSLELDDHDSDLVEHVPKLIEIIEIFLNDYKSRSIILPTIKRM